MSFQYRTIVERVTGRLTMAAFVFLCWMMPLDGVAHACGVKVRVSFVEASPDIFLIEHLKESDGNLVSVMIDLSASAGGAHVDTPYGPSRLNMPGDVVFDRAEGFGHTSTGGTFHFKAFPPSTRFSYQIDLDDHATGGDFNPNWLTANELEGGSITAIIRLPNGSVKTETAPFNAEGVAEVGNKACV